MRLRVGVVASSVKLLGNKLTNNLIGFLNLEIIVKLLLGLDKFSYMESSRSSRVDKRGYEQDVVDDAEHVPGSKKPKLPALARFVSYNFFIE